MMRLDELANRLELAGDQLAAASTTITVIDPGPRSLGADTAGALGQAGRELHRILAIALSARSRETAAHGARLAETGQALRAAAGAYRAADEEAS
ncbi:hypothetical protein [Dactylosporangium matsuzakiense]|uniref:Excreted virulence factor EspC (Type VII ESX diderm) n=1 Tax=Dactylosporangium matsuzakiense TaxID=53360 RepID=A0A9W6NPC1_9ACTN|nr:hypothetical protein [Dactylosporangium matsuzakiense]UWZ45505.1 hypothetical protein Dmats_02930 [Dactylosporangium matsuzakiense]GLL04334.1 hypothetical protein GCM10017581_060810 [Dactylosporangium matsuzakiense]